jgi:hypothetical protein
MKLSRSNAALLSAEERRLVEASGPWQVKDLVRAIERTRRLRDKARDLLQRQSIASRRSGSRGGARTENARSDARVRLFERALDGFRAQLAKLDLDSTRAMRDVGADSPAGRMASARKADRSAATKTAAKKPAAKKATAKKGAAKKATAKKAVAKKATGNKAAAKKAAGGAAKRSSATKTAGKPAARKSAAKPSAAKTSVVRKAAPRSAAGRSNGAVRSVAGQAPAKKPSARKSTRTNTARPQPSTAPSARRQPPAASRRNTPVVRRVPAGSEPETHGPSSGPPQLEISSKARIPIPRELGAPFGPQVTGQRVRRVRGVKGPR